MRIALYTPNYPGLTGEGGIGSYTQAMAHGLAEFGHEVHVLTPGNQLPVQDGRVRVHFARTTYIRGADRIFPGVGACWRVRQSLRHLVNRYRVNIVELANWEGYGLLFIRGRRPPTVVRLATSSKEAHEIDSIPASRPRHWDVLRERWQARSADLLVTHSGAHRKEMATELDIPVDRIHLLPLGVTTSPDWVRPPRQPGPPTVVYLGRLEHRKGTFELLQAVPHVLVAIPDARFVLIGADRAHCPGGRTHAEFLEQDFPPEVRRHVTLAGRLPQPEVDRWLQTADVFVAPSRYESFGLIFLEAMRWGTPVIGTTAGGIPEVVENGTSGLLVNPESSDELATAIIRLLRDSALRTALGEAGRRRVEDQFSVRRMAERVAAMYGELIGRRAGRREGTYAN